MTFPIVAFIKKFISIISAFPKRLAHLPLGESTDETILKF